MLKGTGINGECPQGSDKKEGRFLASLNRLYERNLRGLLENRRKRVIGLIIVLLLFCSAVALVPLKLVTVKMLPFDNKSELQIIIDMPEGTTLEGTALAAQQIGQYLKTVPEVTNYQSYTGTAAPFNFNGLVRHYYLRSGSNVSDIQVNFVCADDRKAQSHDIAKRIRPEIKKIGDRYNARIKVVEVPPGPPVLSTLVAEVYGPDFERQIGIAGDIKKIFNTTGGVVDVDWYVGDNAQKISFAADKEKSAYNGISTETVSRSLNTALHGMTVGLVHMEKEKEPVELYLRAPLADRAGIDRLKAIGIASASGAMVPLSELVKVTEGIEDKTIYHKNLKRVVYVTGDVAGSEESPVYAILKMKEAIRNLRLPEGYELKQYSSGQPRLREYLFHEMGRRVAYNL